MAYELQARGLDSWFMSCRPGNSSTSCENNAPACNQHRFNGNKTEQVQNTLPFVCSTKHGYMHGCMQPVLGHARFQSHGITIWLGVILKTSESL